MHRPSGAVLATAGLTAVVLVLVATPDAQGWVLGAWILVLAGVAAVALGVALGFRREADLDAESGERPYLTADWVGGAQVFTVGGGLDPAELEPTEAEAEAEADAEAEAE